VNLVDNAVKYGVPPVRLCVSETATHAGVRVLDAGDDFEAGESSRMVEAFTRGEETGVSGTGLGLTIASRVASAHGGRLQFSAIDGGGFEVQLMLALPIET